MKPKIEVYEDEGGGWRWNLRVNNKITADSGEAYSRKGNCVRAVRRLIEVLGIDPASIKVVGLD